MQRYPFQQSEKAPWRNYVSKVNSQTSVKSVWNRICKIKGKKSNTIVHRLSVSGKALTYNPSHNSSSAFSTDACTDAFTSVHNKAERHNLNFSSENVYNRPFCIKEFQDALVRRVHDTSAQISR